MGILGNTAIRFVNKTEDNAYIYKGFWYHNSKIYQNLETYSDIYPFFANSGGILLWLSTKSWHVLLVIMALISRCLSENDFSFTTSTCNSNILKFTAPLLNDIIILHTIVPSQINRSKNYVG